VPAGNAGVQAPYARAGLLTFYAEKSAAEIAQTLGTTPGAVRVGRHRALVSMRECLEARRAS
jgi:DNA-directed RNA polymerase specialized sigma24 family protein